MLPTKRCLSLLQISKQDWENSKKIALGGTRTNSLQFRRMEKKEINRGKMSNGEYNDNKLETYVKL